VEKEHIANVVADFDGGTLKAEKELDRREKS
jgi:hypothetical protein